MRRSRATLGKGRANPEKGGGKEDNDKRTCAEDGKEGRGKEFIGTWKDICPQPTNKYQQMDDPNYPISTNLHLVDDLNRHTKDE